MGTTSSVNRLRTVSTIILLLLLFPSCTKDKTTPPCTGVSMSGERERFTGKWRWYKTTVEEWFDLGPSIYHDYNPVNQGYNYYFTLSEDGLLKGYRNDTLIHDFILSEVEYEKYEGVNTSNIRFKLNCTPETLSLIMFSSNVTHDTIHTREIPLSFDDVQNHLRTSQNYFVRE